MLQNKKKQRTYPRLMVYIYRASASNKLNYEKKRDTNAHNIK